MKSSPVLPICERHREACASPVPPVFVTGVLGLLMVLPGLCASARSGELHRKDLTLFPPTDGVVAKTDGISVDVRRGVLCTSGKLQSKPNLREHAVFASSADKVFVNARLFSANTPTLIEIATSGDQKAWKPALVAEVLCPDSHLAGGPLGMLDLAAAGPHQFVRLSVWREGDAPASALVGLGLPPLGERISKAESGPLELGEVPAGGWIWAKMEDLPGTPPGKSSVPYQPPEAKQIGAVQTGTLAPGIYGYLLRPYVGKGEADAEGAEPSTSAQLAKAGLLPSLWFQRYSGPNGRVVLDWSGDASKAVNEFWKVVNPAKKGENGGKKPPDGDDLDPLAPGKEEKGYEIWRQDPGSPDYRLIARVPDPRIRSWGDPGPMPAKAPVLKKAEPKDVNKVGTARGVFGDLAPGTYYYRLAGIYPEAMTEAGPPIKVAAEKGSGAVALRLVKSIGACGYAVWRSSDPNRWENTLVAVLEEDELYWVDPGFPASKGTAFALEVRAAKAKEGLAGAQWRSAGAGKALKLEAGDRWIEYRVTGKTDCLSQPARAVRVIVSDKEPTAEDLSPRAYLDLRWRLEPFAVPGDHGWCRPDLFPKEAAAPADAFGVTVANAFQMTSGGGTFFTRNFEVHVHNPIAGRWEKLFEVRNNAHRSMVVTLDRVIQGHVRSFGPYQSNSGAYAFDPTPGFLPLLLPAAITDLAINGCMLRDRPLCRSQVDGRIAAPLGENEIACRLTGLPMGDAAAKPPMVTLALAVAEGRKGEYQEVGRQEFALNPGEAKAYRQGFSVSKAGEHRVQVTMVSGGKTHYRFTYWLNAGNALELERLHPSYRGDLFASDPDRQFRFRLNLAAVREAKVACELTESSGGRSVWSKTIQLAPGSPATIEIPAANLRCGGYRFRADAGELGKVENALRILPKVPGVVDNYLRSDGVMVRDGKPFLPICFGSAPSEHAADSLPECLTTCGMNSVGYSSPDKESVDLLARNGILYSGGSALHRRPDSMDWDEARMTNRILTAPTAGQYAWFMGEELDIFNETQGRAKKTSIWWEGFIRSYELGRELAPFAPIYTVAFDANCYTGPWAPITKLCDVFGLEPYLRPHYDDDPEQLSAGANERRAWIATAVMGAKGRSLWKGMYDGGEPSQKTVWAFPLQAWDGRCWQPWQGRNINKRVLSLTEHRFMAYDALLLGATGLQWWGYHWDYFHIKFNPLQWEALRAVTEELAAVAPAWLDKDVTADARLLHGSVDIGAREHGGKSYLFVANHRCDETIFAVQCPEAWKKVARYSVVNEGRECEAKDGVIRERIGPFGVRIYTDDAGLPPMRLAKLLADPRYNGSPKRSRIANNLACEWNGARIEGNYKYWTFNHQAFANDGDPETAYITADWFKRPPPGLKPYTLIVTLKDPAKVERVILRTWRPKHWPDAVEALEDYDLDICSDGNWETIAQVKKNEEEVRTHGFPARTIEALRLKIHKGLYVNEIEAYGPGAAKL